MLAQRPVELLLVEDNAADVRLVVEALRQSATPTHLSVVRDGRAALAFLRHEGSEAATPRPALIMLDLDLPGKHGREVLSEIKTDEALRTIPVVVLTGSREPEDVSFSYDLYANAYVAKPLQLDPFVSAIGAILRFWFETATPVPSAEGL